MKSFMDNDYVFIIHEIEQHPNSILPKIKSCFENVSVINVTYATQLSNYRTKPIFDKKYLFIFENLYLFEQIYKSLDLKIIFPVFMLRRSSDEILIKNLLNSANIPYHFYTNKFTRYDAINLILATASTQLSDNLLKKILSKTGLSPKKINEAVMILNNVGYSSTNISKYLDNNVFVSHMDILDILLHYPKITKKKYKAVLNYLMIYRNSYSSYIKKELLKEVELYICVYNDILNGIVTEKGLPEYLHSIGSLTSYKYMHILTMFETKSINQLKVVEAFIKDSTFLQLVNVL